MKSSSHWGFSGDIHETPPARRRDLSVGREDVGQEGEVGGRTLLPGQKIRDR